MGRFVKKFFRVTMSLTSATILVIALQAQTNAGEAIESGAFLLAENGKAPKEEKTLPAPACAQEKEKLKQEKAREQKVIMEKQAPKTRSMQDLAAAAGTKKIGGQIIRNKEVPKGE